MLSRRIHDVALPLFYRNIKLDSQRSHEILLRVVDQDRDIASLVRSLDLTEYEDPALPCILPRALTRLPQLQSLHLQLGELKSQDTEYVHKIFFGPNLDTLVIENTHWKTDPACLAEIIGGLESLDQTAVSNIRSLTCRIGSRSSHLPTSLGSQFVDTTIFSKVLPIFPGLRALDLSSTPVDPAPLLALDSRASLQYLRISSCQDNDTSTLAHFISTHPAVRSSLVVLDATGVRFGEQGTGAILQNLPSTLRSLNLSSSTMTANHVPRLQKLCQHLKELSVGHGLTMDNVEAAILSPYFNFDADVTCRSIDEASSKEASEHALILGPIRDAIAFCNIRRRLASVSQHSLRTGTRRSHVRYLDLSSMDVEEQGRITNSVLLGEHSIPLEVIAVSDINQQDYRVLGKLCGRLGWRDRWANEMIWVERK